MDHEWCLSLLSIGVIILLFRSFSIRRDFDTTVRLLRMEIEELKAAGDTSPERTEPAQSGAAHTAADTAWEPYREPVTESAVVEEEISEAHFIPAGPEPVFPSAEYMAKDLADDSPVDMVASEDEPKPASPDFRARWETFKANVDWELFTGVKLFAWLGGLALFIGAGFFVKYSIDRNLIPPALRLAISAFTGLLLIVSSARIRRERFSVLRHTLGAGGIGVLYSAVFAATLYYEYISKPVGFGLLSVVSSAAFVLAVYFRGIPISVLGAVGAYLTPMLVSTGQGNLPGLFVYLAIVNTGLYQVVIRLNSAGLLLVAACGTLGTLFLASFSGAIHPTGAEIAGVWIANMALFSFFLDRQRTMDGAERLLSWVGNAVYGSAPVVALLLLDRQGAGPLMIATAAMAGAVIVAWRDGAWFNRVVPYSTVIFIVTFLWAWQCFDPGKLSWGFVGLLLYGVVGGLGPVLLIHKYGLDQGSLNWLRIFPAALGATLLSIIVRQPLISFWLWPVILLLEGLGILISFLFGAVLQAALLVLFLFAGGLIWVLRMPAGFGEAGFFGFLVLAGTALSLVVVFALKKLSAWRETLAVDDPSFGLSDAGRQGSEWLSALPLSAVFILLAATFLLQRPPQPNPGMVTLACFLGLALFLSRRLLSRTMSMTVLLSSLAAQASWVMQPGLSLELHGVAFLWSAVFFICAILAPFLFFRSFEKWASLWMTWAVFEALQGFFAIRAADHVWSRDMSGWLPLVLAFLKLPAVAVLQQRLKTRPERNAILAFHGGILLFYVSAIPVMLLDRGWLGLTLAIEAMLLLWLNRRVLHEGLRWVAVFMAPAGLLLLFFSLPQMKQPGDMVILNAAVLAVAGAVAALSAAVLLSGFPQRSLGGLDLPVYFRWLAVSSGFFLLNLVIADLFAEKPGLFRPLPGPDGVQALCYALVWLTYGAFIWIGKNVSSAMRHVGLLLVCMGAGFLFLLPVLFDQFVPGLSPVLNRALPAYLFALIVLLFLGIRALREQIERRYFNLLVALGLLTGFIALKIQMSTVVQHGLPFQLFLHASPSMSVGSAAGWLIYGLALLCWPRGLDRPFRVAGVVLIGAGIIKALAFPFLHSVVFGSMRPLVNMPTLLYLFALIVLTALTLDRQRQHWPFESTASRPFWGTVLGGVSFIILNIEISSSFTLQGRSFSLSTHQNLAHQLAYSLGWLVYSIGLLAVGIRWSTRKVRWASLVLMVGTSLKIFFLDLWNLGQLYRVASFVGLAAVLMLVSFLYQRFLVSRDDSDAT